MKESARGADTVTLKIPRPLYENLQSIIQGTGFRSVTEFAIYVLRDLASTGRPGLATPPTPIEPAPGAPTPAPAAASADAPLPDRLTPEEVDLVRRRLKSLGYL